MLTLTVDMSSLAVVHFVLKHPVVAQPGTSTLPTSSAECWASLVLHLRFLSMAVLMVAVQMESRSDLVDSSALATRHISLNVLMTKLSLAIADPVVLLVETLISLELNVHLQ